MFQGCFFLSGFTHRKSVGVNVSVSLFVSMAFSALLVCLYAGMFYICLFATTVIFMMSSSCACMHLILQQTGLSQTCYLLLSECVDLIGCSHKLLDLILSIADRVITLLILLLGPKNTDRICLNLKHCKIFGAYLPLEIGVNIPFLDCWAECFHIYSKSKVLHGPNKSQRDMGTDLY